MKTKKKRVFAFAMAMFCIAQSLACAMPEEENLELTPISIMTQTGDINMEKTENNIATNAIQLTKAIYPEMAQYPKTDGFTWDEEEYEAWRTSLAAQRPENTEYQSGIREFYEATMQEFLIDMEGKNKV